MTIPKGVDDGTRIRLAGKGEAGTRGGATGDLYLFVNVESHNLFKRSDVKGFYDKWYQAENMHLVVVSGAKSDDVKLKIEKVFNKIRQDKVEKPKFMENENVLGLQINTEFIYTYHEL